MPLNKAFKLNEYEHWTSFSFHFIVIVSSSFGVVMRTMWEVLLIFFSKRYVKANRQTIQTTNMSQSIVPLFSSFRIHRDILLWAKNSLLFSTHVNRPNYNHDHVMYLVFPQSSRRSGTTAIIIKNFFPFFFSTWESHQKASLMFNAEHIKITVRRETSIQIWILEHMCVRLSQTEFWN